MGLLRREVNRVLGHILDTYYLMVEQVLLHQPGLHLQRSTIPVNLSVQTGRGLGQTCGLWFPVHLSKCSGFVWLPAAW